MLDQHTIYQSCPGPEPEHISYVFADSVPGTHVLCFQMSGKKPEHTVLDRDGNIVQDQVIKIQEVCIEDIPLGHILVKNTVYHHDHNGTTQPVCEPFYGVMGCNGRAEMTFTTPIYLWFLENN